MMAGAPPLSAMNWENLSPRGAAFQAPPPLPGAASPRSPAMQVPPPLPGAVPLPIGGYGAGSGPPPIGGYGGSPPIGGCGGGLPTNGVGGPRRGTLQIGQLVSAELGGEGPMPDRTSQFDETLAAAPVAASPFGSPRGGPSPRAAPPASAAAAPPPLPPTMLSPRGGGDGGFAAGAAGVAPPPPLKLPQRGSVGDPSRASPRGGGASAHASPRGGASAHASPRSGGRYSAGAGPMASPMASPRGGALTPRADGGPLAGEFKVRGGVFGRQLQSRTLVYEPATKALLYYASAADATAGAHKAKGARKVVSVARGDPFKDEGLHLTFVCQDGEGTDGGADVVAIAPDAKECARWLSVVNAS